MGIINDPVTWNRGFLSKTGAFILKSTGIIMLVILLQTPWLKEIIDLNCKINTWHTSSIDMDLKSHEDISQASKTLTQQFDINHS